MTFSADPITAEGSTAARRALREAALARRASLPEDTRRRCDVALATHLEALLARLAPSVLGFCWPIRGEPDLRDAVGRWLARCPTRRAALPVVLEKQAPLSFRRWLPGIEMALDRHGIPYPAAGVTLQPEVMLIPLNAFDAAGYRLGYGGGYFDRTLAALPSVAVGVGYELSRVDSVLPQAHDQPMAWLVTEQGVFAGAR